MTRENEQLPALPTVDFGGTQVSRLIVGGNPFVWNSHYTEALNEDMKAFFTPEQIVKTLHRCRQVGINTVQARGDYHRILHYLEIFRREGGQLHFIAQTASEMSDIHTNIKVIAAFGAVGIYFHGSETDKYWLSGTMDKLQDFLKTIRDTGVRVGIAGHHPEIFDYIEERGWDLDFYMTPFYNVARKPRESAVVTGKFEEEEFNEEDPPRICKFIQQTEKQILAYKILGCGRKSRSQEEALESFKWAFQRIKPNDCVVVGMFDKYLDQPAVNVRYAAEAIAEAEKNPVKL